MPRRRRKPIPKKKLRKLLAKRGQSAHGNKRKQKKRLSEARNDPAETNPPEPAASSNSGALQHRSDTPDPSDGDSSAPCSADAETDEASNTRPTLKLSASDMLQLPQRVSKAQPHPNSPVPAHLQCSSCSKPLFNAFQTPHGCRLCQPCVTDLLSPSERRRCPGNTEACRDPDEDTEVSQSTCLPDMATRREVGRLQVLCPNCSAGCTVALSWTRMDEHLDRCDFQTVDCGLCSQPVMRKDSQRHADKECPQRKEKCDLCDQQVAFSDLKSEHLNLESEKCCPKFSAACPHCKDKVRNQNRTMDRKAYLAHLPECPEQPVECKYSHLGCRARIRRSDIQKHYRDFTDSHLELVDSRLRQAAALQPTTPNRTSATRSSASPATASDSNAVADVKRRVGSVYEQFKRLQINVANWAHSTNELEQMADRFGGVAQLRSLLASLEERSRVVDQLQQQVQQLQQQMQQLQQQMQQLQQQQRQQLS